MVAVDAFVPAPTRRAREQPGKHVSGGTRIGAGSGVPPHRPPGTANAHRSDLDQGHQSRPRI